MTTPTGNAVPSTAPQDLLFNAERLDEVVNSIDATFTDRNGVERRTVAGSMAVLDQGVDAVAAQVSPALAAIAAGSSLITQSVATIVQSFHEKLDDVSLPGDLDATMVAFKGRSVQLALQDMPTIQQFGGAGDFDIANPGTYNNNFTALVNAINTGAITGRPYGRVVRFPFILGQTNVYRFEGGAIPAGLITPVFDDGVSYCGDNFSFDGVVRGSPRRVNSSAASNRVFSEFGDPLSGMGEPGRPERLKSRWISEGERYRNLTRTLAPSTEARAVKVPWPGGSVEADFAADGETTLSGTSATFAPSTNDGCIHLAMFRLKVGEEISAQMTFTPGQSGFGPWVLGRSAMGHHGVTFGPGNGNVAESGKRSGQAATQVAVNVPGMDTHQSYWGDSALVSLRRDSPVGLTVMFNGLVVMQYEFPEPMLEVGFGAYASAATAFAWTNFASKIGGQRMGAKTRMVHVIADSRGADRYDAWPRHFKDVANGGAGIRVPRVTNQGVPGQASGDQRAILLARAGQTGYTAHGFPLWTTDALIAVGTNDIQGLVAPSTYRNNLVDMVTWAIADGIVPFLGLPEVWYQQGNSGGTGQASLNYASGTPYRAAMMSVAAQFGLVTVDDGLAMGPLIANYVNPALTPYFGMPTVSIPDAPGADPMLIDNIHPGAFAGRIKGGNWAKAFLGYHAGMHPSAKSDWQVLPASQYLNGWTPSGPDPVRWRMQPGDRVQWGGYAIPGSYDSSGYAPLISIPQGLRPRRTFRGFGTSNLGVVGVAALTTIDVNFLAAGASFVDVCGISYDLD